MRTLPDYLRPGLVLVSIGLNPSIASVEAGYYFAHPRNRFWPAMRASGLAPADLEPGPEAVGMLFERHGIGFTDVVKRPSAGGASLRAADFRRWAPVLHEKLLASAPRVAWFHGKQAYSGYLRYALGRREAAAWGLQPPGATPWRVFVSPNPSPANAAYSLDDLVRWFRELANLARTVTWPDD